MILPQKIKLVPQDSVLNALALAFIFTWILSYPMHGPLLEEIFGPQAYILGHFFTFSHGLGMIIFSFLPPVVLNDKRLVVSSGAVIFILTCIWTFIPLNNPNVISVILGLISAYLVLSWIPVFLNEKSPVITIGLAMTTANVLLGLTCFTHFLSYPFVKIAASLTGLAPLLGALYIGNRHFACNLTKKEAGNKKIKTSTIVSIIAFSLAAYFSGGFWFRAIVPLFYSQWPAVIGIDSFLYAAIYLALAVYARKFSYLWLGPVALSLLGLGLTIAIISLDRPVEIIITLLLIIAGLCATDLYYWLTLRDLSKILNTRVFGLGLGLSLFFITAPGIALDTQLLPGPLLSPATAVLGACLLFMINPLIIWYLRPLHQYEQVKADLPNNLDEKTCNDTGCRN
ncbi:MAG: hypothetical protein A4E54_01905 [Pelotomaculum sp. PtaB.Bin117]|nr:MAG: hypothetical protein A4E54_01905 [Pelotomaculum sp. PtaB.Bin117]